MILLFDIGNTNTHAGLANDRRVVKQTNLPTANWFNGTAAKLMRKFVGRARLDGVALCSVVPRATPFVCKIVRRLWGLNPLELTSKTLCGVGIDYPKPDTIGPDRLANAVAARHRFGAPVVVLDFGTAVTLDVVNRAGNYAGGIIAPSPEISRDYLAEKTALLPRIELKPPKSVVGRDTDECLRSGLIFGFADLVSGLLIRLKKEWQPEFKVVGTGGGLAVLLPYLSEKVIFDPNLTLKGIYLTGRKQ